MVKASLSPVEECYEVLLFMICYAVMITKFATQVDIQNFLKLRGHINIDSSPRVNLLFKFDDCRPFII